MFIFREELFSVKPFCFENLSLCLPVGRFVKDSKRCAYHKRVVVERKGGRTPINLNRIYQGAFLLLIEFLSVVRKQNIILLCRDTDMVER